MHIRQASFSDSAQIAEVHVASWQTTYRGQIPDEHLNQLSIHDRTAMWEKLFRGNQMRAIVADDGAEIRGFTSFGKCRDVDVDDATGEVYTIYLRAKAQGTGLGRDLWQAALRELVEQGYTKACVWVLDSNSLARGFYEKMGCTLDGQSMSAVIGGKEVLELRYVVSIA